MNVELRTVSKNEKAFLLEAFAQGLRVDGRRDVDQREMTVNFVANGNCELQLGRTK